MAEKPYWEFAGPGRIIFGIGSVKELPGCLEPGPVLLVRGSDSSRIRPVENILAADRRDWISQAVAGEPTPAVIDRILAAGREAACSQVVAVGGGSVLDAGKAAAALLTNPGELLDYLEVIGRGRPLSNQPAPFFAVPTTAGTGSEATRNAVITDPGTGGKVSMRSRLLLPRVALVDPALTVSLPPRVTADSGLDALAQLIEGFVSSRATPLTDALARDGIARAAAALPRVFRDGNDLAAREEMALAALFSGMVLANSGLGAVHGLAGPLGGMFPVPHGAACARLLPEVLETNLAALRERAPCAPALTRMVELAELLTGRPAEPAEGYRAIRNLTRDLAIRSLSAFGFTPAAIPSVVVKARRSSSMRGNPLELTEEELAGILSRGLDNP